MRFALNSSLIKYLNHFSLRDVFALCIKLKGMIYLIVAIHLVIIIRLLKPFVTIRIYEIDFSRIGRAEYANWYLSEKKQGIHNGKYLDFFYFNTSSRYSNKQYIKMWRRELKVFPFEKLASAVGRLNRKIPGYHVHEIPIYKILPELDDYQIIDGIVLKNHKFEKRLQAVLNSKHPNIKFTSSEEEHGVRELKKLGIPSGSSFICFHSRDSAYLRTIDKGHNWNYHNFRDSSIQNYVLAAEEMAQRDCYAIRLGSIVKERIKSSNQKVIDYACDGMRTDFLDIFLSSKCRFTLCSDSGISSPSEIFKRPMVYVNWTILKNISIYVSKGLCIFKKFYLKDEDRYMTFPETMNLELGGEDTNEILTKLNLELIENTPEEISDVTIEMDERLNGSWVTTEEDKKLQDRFWALFPPFKLKSPDLLIGANFLRKNKYLLS